MKITILGSGGFTPTPYPNCKCEQCKIALADKTKIRTGHSIYIHDLDLLLDTPRESLQHIKYLGFFPKNICYSHWHPDHTEGWRVLEYFNNTPNVYIQNDSLLLEHVPGLKYLQENKHINIINWKTGMPFSYNNISISYVLMDKQIPVYCFILKTDNNNVLIAPDHSKYLLDTSINLNLDLIIMNLGISNGTNNATTFNDNLNIIEKFHPKKVILTHIEAHTDIPKIAMPTNLVIASDKMIIKP